MNSKYSLSHFIVITLLVFALVNSQLSAQQPADNNTTGSGQSAQSQEDEIKVLKQQILDIQDELAKAYARIADLESRLGILVPGKSIDGVDPLIIPEDKPLASPDTLLIALQQDYEKATEGLEIDGNESVRKNYMRAVRSWISRVEKKYRQRIEWKCDLIDREILSNREEHIIVVVRDPETGDRWSNEFEITLPKQLTSKLNLINSTEPIVIRGIFRTALNINESRREAGSFNDPQLVGSFVEYGYELSVQSIVQADDTKKEKSIKTKDESINNDTDNDKDTNKNKGKEKEKEDDDDEEDGK